MKKKLYLYTYKISIIEEILIRLIIFCVEDLKIDLYTLLNNVSISICPIHRDIQINNNNSKYIKIQLCRNYTKCINDIRHKLIQFILDYLMRECQLKLTHQSISKCLNTPSMICTTQYNHTQPELYNIRYMYGSCVYWCNYNNMCHKLNVTLDSFMEFVQYCSRKEFSLIHKIKPDIMFRCI